MLIIVFHQFIDFNIQLPYSVYPTFPYFLKQWFFIYFPAYFALSTECLPRLVRVAPSWLSDPLCARWRTQYENHLPFLTSMASERKTNTCTWFLFMT